MGEERCEVSDLEVNASRHPWNLNTLLMLLLVLRTLVIGTVRKKTLKTVYIITDYGHSLRSHLHFALMCDLSLDKDKSVNGAHTL